MTKLQTLYGELLAQAEENPARTAAEFEQIVTYMKNSSAIHHGEYVRTCYLPKLFTAENFARFTADIALLYGIFGKITAAYMADPAYRRLFGFDARTEALILRSHWQGSLLPMARIDFFYREDTDEYKFCEFNTDGTSAMNEDRELNRAQRQFSGVLAAFGAQHELGTFELFDRWVDAFCGIYRRIRGTARPPRVAIVDYMECGTTNEFEVFRDRFEANGIPAEVCDVRYLHYDGKTLTGADGLPIDAIYRRAVTSDVLAHFAESEALLAAVQEDAVLLVGDFHTQLVHNKTIFRILQAPETFALLSAEEIAYIKAHVPYTAALAGADFAQLRQNKDGWILKPQDSYGSKGIHAGVECTQAEWEKILRALDNPADRENYILQEFYMPYRTENYGLVDGRFQKAAYYNLTGVYVYDGTPAGVYSRVSLSPIISSQYSEKTLATVIVKG